MTDYGPFSVDPAKITALGGAKFARFVTRLLAAEMSTSALKGAVLDSSHIVNLSDEGVDARVQHAEGTTQLPAGDTGWQFKAGDLEPADCKKELEGAGFALEILHNGGSYRLALGKSLTAPQIARRKTALEEKAVELGLTLTDGMFEVLTADHLARWSEEHPSLAADSILGGPGTAVQTFDQWAASSQLQSRWTTSPRREAAIEEIREVITGTEPIALHVEGVSGVGKTRLTLEALRGQPYEAIVVYVPAADQLLAALLNHLTIQGRTAVVVIDNCDRRQHKTYAQMLPAGTRTRLITIGEPDPSGNAGGPPLPIEGLEKEAMDELLKTNQPTLWPEARRVVIEVAAGNVDYAIQAAGALERRPGSAGDLVTADDLRAYVVDDLPTGALFTASSVLALFSRVGFDREVASEVALLATHLQIPEANLREAARQLERGGQLSRQGRYRSVGPYPLAIFLARQAWNELGEAIVGDLMPNLTPDLLIGLFARASEIGGFEIGSPAARQILAADGPLASFDSIARAGSRLLPHLAVIAPTAVAQRLGSLVRTATSEELIGLTVRRDLVWALGKLAWHTATFEDAADALLRLSIHESETWANNATGTWIDLFGTMLPGTAASPDTRIQYLQRCAGSQPREERLLAVKAADHVLSYHESITISGELQGGAIVEPRGMPSTYGEAWRYKQQAIDILRGLTEDPDDEIAAAALEALAQAIHPVLEVPAVREHLAAALATLPTPALRRVRREVAGLKSTFERIEDAATRGPALEQLAAALPPESPLDALWVLTHTRSWDIERDDLKSQVLQAAQTVGDGTAVDELLDALEERDVPAAFEIGWALAHLAPDNRTVIQRLEAAVERENGAALIGFLWACYEAGELAAFDDYLDTAPFEQPLVLRLSTRGPRTERAAARVRGLLNEVSVQDGALALFGWLRDGQEAELVDLLSMWLPRISSQGDYNAAVDFLALQLFRREGPLDDLDPVLLELVALRRDYPKLGQKEWDWVQLGARWVNRDALRLTVVLADLIEGGSVSGYSSSQETRLLQDAVRTGGVPAWEELIERIHNGSWRLSMTFDRWLGNAVGADDAARWVNGELERARTLASVTGVGAADILPTAKYLLDTFGDDERIASSLRNDFITGGWTGHESDRVARQIEHLRNWVARPGESEAVKSWARDMIDSLETYRASVLEEEAEGR